MIVKSSLEIDMMRKSANLVALTLAEVAKSIKPGVSLLALDRIAETFILDSGGIPAFKGYNGFPSTLCTSLNEQVVHGIPSNYILQDGDILSVDCGVKFNGYIGDSAYTFAIGDVKPEVKQLLKVTIECLYLGIDKAVAGNRVGDISCAIQTHAETHGFGVVRELVGHGVGKTLHEKPEIPNFGLKGRGPKLLEGVTIAIEPMINLGSRRIVQLGDGWTIVTADGLPSAHFEHTVMVGKESAEVLSSFKLIEQNFKAA